ncbi:hypothetical protein BO71DRAFT_396047 [Aspergillus ellipticus CBS 707.79]|uniref:Transcriptional regulator n=1 Tax=Aspergillus ellipticus CBS 707.79 TaxID=1448320 RepID=A0A319DJB2_9EURO|nr:hypothetical protein BO71DRAFT_396047 [Aspergillus ellipticus CBS 707.79]
MYLPAFPAETDQSILRDFICENPLGLFTTITALPSHPLLHSSHIPWILDFDESKISGPSYLGRLRGHMGKVNPQTKAMIEEVTSTSTSTPPSPSPSSARYLTQEALITFTAPATHYITPKFYIETKTSTGKVVPTWNYSAVQVRGRVRLYCDSKSEKDSHFLSQQLSDLSLLMETSVMGYTAPGEAWAVEDAPALYIDILEKTLVGMEFEITSLVGKFKMSQEKPRADREGVGGSERVEEDGYCGGRRGGGVCAEACGNL